MRSIWKFSGAAAAVIGMLSIAGCGAASFEPYRVKAYSGGKQVGEWTSACRPCGTEDRAWFKDKETGRVVEIGGDFVVEQLTK